MAAAALLRSLHRCHWAGTEAAVCTLGRHGAVVADWIRDRIDHIALELLDGDAGVPTPAAGGTGSWRNGSTGATWSRQGHLPIRSRPMACAPSTPWPGPPASAATAMTPRRDAAERGQLPEKTKGIGEKVPRKEKVPRQTVLRPLAAAKRSHLVW